MLKKQGLKEPKESRILRELNVFVSLVGMIC